MNKSRITALILLILASAIGFFVFSSEKNPDSVFHFKLGLDLAGGSQLIYEADVSNLEDSEVSGAMQSLRDTIERRVNLFGVSEPIVQVEEGGLSGSLREQRLLVELPGVTDLSEAMKLIGETPLLEFKLLKAGVDIEGSSTPSADSFEETGLSGRFLERASLDFANINNEPYVVLTFDTEGKKLFAELTKENVGRVMAIFLDGEILSAPVIQEEIPGGNAQITGNFNPEEARDLVQNLNYGALPVPIKLIATESVGASLGHSVLDRGLKAGFLGISLVFLFLIIYYRLPGLVASLSLVIYVFLMLLVFKLIPVTLTAAGIAGFVISVGMAVDANILIFERMKDEYLSGSNLSDSIAGGFKRAWASIRDGNISSIITAIVLFWIGTSAVQGFALVFGLGVALSMFSAITLTRTFLKAVAPVTEGRFTKFIFGIKRSK